MLAIFSRVLWKCICVMCVYDGGLLCVCLEDRVDIGIFFSSTCSMRQALPIQPGAGRLVL